MACGFFNPHPGSTADKKVTLGGERINGTNTTSPLEVDPSPAQCRTLLAEIRGNAIVPISLI